MRYSASEKFEIIELVEQSSLSIPRTLAPTRVISRSPAISANLCAGFLAATHQFQLCS
jgi:hypothetical protein